MNLSRLLTMHAIITFAAGSVLIFAPGFIPQTIALRIEPDAFFLSYLLGAGEIAIAFLSFTARNFKDLQALRAVSWTLIVFHALSGAVELLALARGVSSAIVINIVFRILAVALFGYYGVWKISDRSQRA